MQELTYAAERDKNGGALKRILNACGKYSTLCPYCFNTDTGEGKEDHPDHAATECTHKSANAARANLEAKTIERQLREGPQGKMNAYAYSLTERANQQLPEENDAQCPEDPPEIADPNENKLTRILYDDTTTGAQRTLNIYNHQLQTLTKMHAGTGDTTDEGRKGLRRDTADLIWSAHNDHSNPSTDPTLKYTHLAADTPTPLLIWIKKYTRTTCQHMTSPLFLTLETFVEPPTLMPTSMTQGQKDRWKMKEQYIHHNTGLEPDWSEIPWETNGVLALTSGKPNSIPDPSAHILA
jgi:hypothetical protein